MAHLAIYAVLGLVSYVASAPRYGNNPLMNESLFDGDILRNRSSDRSAIPFDSERWPFGEIYFKISPELTSLSGLINQAMSHIEENTCIRFFERETEKDYIRIFKGEGCYSGWGREGGPQKLSLGDGCDYFGVIVHELMHAIGFEHEHNRSDRDKYLKINWENIEKKWHFAFHRLQPDEERLLSDFDYKSIMLYGSTDFAKAPNLFSMVDINGNKISDIYDKKYMSEDDIFRVNKLYECNNV